MVAHSGHPFSVKETYFWVQNPFLRKKPTSNTKCENVYTVRVTSSRSSCRLRYGYYLKVSTATVSQPTGSTATGYLTVYTVSPSENCVSYSEVGFFYTEDGWPMRATIA